VVPLARRRRRYHAQGQPWYYWGVRSADAPTRYYWDDQSVSREEYAASMGDDVPAS